MTLAPPPADRARSCSMRRKPSPAAAALATGPWTPEAISRLGRASDGEIAREIGVSLQAVAARRARLGIPAFGATGGARPRAQEAAAARVTIRLTADERAVCLAAAGDEPLSEWARRQMLAAARKR